MALTTSEITAKVIKIVADVKRIPPESVRLDATLAELGLDSLDTVNLLFELESAFDIDIPDQEAKSISTVNDIVTRLQAVLRSAKPSGEPAGEDSAKKSAGEN